MKNQKNRPLHHPTTRLWIWPVLLAGTISVASSTPGIDLPGMESGGDKLGHFLLFGLLGTLTYRSLALRPAFTRGLAAFLSVVLVSVFGAMDEWHQSLRPQRSAEFEDWVADTLGALIAVLAYHHWSWYRNILEYPVRRILSFRFIRKPAL